MSLSGCCRNLRITIKALLHLHLRRSSLYHRIQSRHLSSSSSMADLKSTFLNVYSTLKSDLLHDPSFEFTDESRLWVEKVHSFQILLRSVSWFSLSLFLSSLPDVGLQCTGREAESWSLCRGQLQAFEGRWRFDRGRGFPLVCSWLVHRMGMLKSFDLYLNL